MTSTVRGVSRRAMLGTGAAAGAAQLAACGVGTGSREERAAPTFRDVEIVWQKQNLGEPRDSAMVKTGDMIRLNFGGKRLNEAKDRALAGEVAAREALQESARALNELFSRRPPNWR